VPVFSTFNGITYRYTQFQEENEDFTSEILAQTVRALDHFVANLQINNWSYHRGTLAARLCNILVLRQIEDHEVFKRSPDCQQVLARHMMATGRREEADKLFLSWFNGVRDPILREKQQYTYHFFVNRLEMVNALKGQPDQQQALLREALPYAEAALFEYPICDNMVYPVLESIQKQVPLSPRAIQQFGVFKECKK
jgi:hypothetical protein